VITSEQNSLWYLGALRIIQAIGEQAGRATHLVEYELPAGARLCALRERGEEEGIYVVEGEAIFTCEEQIMYATAGTLMFLPQETHYHFATGKSPSFRYLTWRTAPGLAHQVLRMGKPGQMLVLAPSPVSSPDQVHHLALLLRHMLAPL